MLSDIQRELKQKNARKCFVHQLAIISTNIQAFVLTESVFENKISNNYFN